MLASKAGDDDTVVDRAVRPRHVRREGGEVQPAGTRHDARPTLRRCSRGCDRSTWSSSTPRARAGPSSRRCPGPGADRAGGDAHRRREVRDALRRAVRGRVCGRGRRHRSQWSRLGARGLRVREEAGRGGISAQRAAPDRARHPRRQRRQGRQHGTRRARKRRAGRRAPEPRLEPERRPRPPPNSCARSMPSARRSSGGSSRSSCSRPGWTRTSTRRSSRNLPPSSPSRDVRFAKQKERANEVGRSRFSSVCSSRRRASSRRSRSEAAPPSINRPVHPSRAPATPPTTAASSSSGSATTRSSAGFACAWDRPGRTTIHAAKCTS